MYVGKTFADVYVELCQNITVFGEKVSPRGVETKEIVQETLCIENPESNLVSIPNRKFSLMHAIAESVLLVTEENKLPCFTKFNQKMEEFSDDGETLYGSYGYRIAGSLNNVVKKLKKDKDTRQAVINIYKLNDLTKNTKDTPCTIALQFMIRNKRLNLHVYMRSNDVVWGTPYDVFMFTNLQMVVANQLNMRVGKYYHTATSFHVYEDNFDLVKYIALEALVMPVEHENENTLEEWKRLAKAFTHVCLNENCVLNDFNAIVAEQTDPVYADLIFAELNHRRAFEKQHTNVMQDVVQKINSHCDKGYNWAKPFTQRWQHD